MGWFNQLFGADQMKALLQRVTSAQVTVADEIVGKINRGLVVFVGVANTDTVEDIDYLVRKIVEMRIFDDADFRSRKSRPG